MEFDDNGMYVFNKKGAGEIKLDKEGEMVEEAQARWIIGLHEDEDGEVKERREKEKNSKTYMQETHACSRMTKKCSRQHTSSGDHETSATTPSPTQSTSSEPISIHPSVHLDARNSEQNQPRSIL